MFFKSTKKFLSGYVLDLGFEELVTATEVYFYNNSGLVNIVTNFSKQQSFLTIDLYIFY